LELFSCPKNLSGGSYTFAPGNEPTLGATRIVITGRPSVGRWSTKRGSIDVGVLRIRAGPPLFVARDSRTGWESYAVAGRVGSRRAVVGRPGDQALRPGQVWFAPAERSRHREPTLAHPRASRGQGPPFIVILCTSTRAVRPVRARRPNRSWSVRSAPSSGTGGVGDVAAALTQPRLYRSQQPRDSPRYGVGVG